MCSTLGGKLAVPEAVSKFVLGLSWPQIDLVSNTREWASFGAGQLSNLFPLLIWLFIGEKSIDTVPFVPKPTQKEAVQLAIVDFFSLGIYRQLFS